MTEQGDMFATIAEELGLALDPIVAAFASDAALRDFLEELGWDLGPALAQLDNLRGPTEQGLSLTDSAGPGDGAAVLQAVVAAYRAIGELRNAGGLPNDFRSEFPGQLAQYLMVEYLLRQRAGLGTALKALGVIRLEDVPAAGGRPPFVRRVFEFSDLGQLFGDPLAFFRNAYRWGQPTFDSGRLLENAADLADAWNVPAYQSGLSDAATDALTTGALDPEAAAGTALRILVVEGGAGGDRLNAGFGLFVLPQTGSAMPGLALMPFATDSFVESVPITESLDLEIRGGLDLASGAAILVRPGQDIAFTLGLDSGSPANATGNVVFALRLSHPGAPFVLIGTAGGSRLEMAGASLGAGTRFHSNGQYEVYAEFVLEGGRLIIKADEGDGFLKTLLPADGIQAPFQLGLGFSSTRGLYFSGSGTLEISVPIHVQLGPLEVQSALIAVRVRPPAGGKPFAIPVEFAATIKGELGPIQAVVENIGLTTEFTFPDGDGNLGPLDVALRFRPPNGVGLAIDAGVVKGGGYLFFDDERGEYAGALELTVADFLSLKAIGLINTRLPGGQQGFSLLVVITADFNPGFQLGFGFTLVGVGGILGLHRVVLLDPLVEGVRTGAINSVLFPTNVIANAPRILSDLRAIFPPHEGTFLIGPMAKLGWGTPTLMSASLGVIIEIPGNVVILGRLRVALPTDETALVVLQATFIGALEFDKRRIWFFASLYESRVLFITLEGEMGLLMDFSDNPNFVLSVGGFHPRFPAPPLPFPAPTRIGLSLINESFARVRAEAYFAVTSNSVQMGCRAEAFFGFDAFSVEGYLSFDALLQLSPVYLIVEISSGFSVKVFGAGVWGVHLRGTLDGVTPWRVRGSAEIEILFFSFDVDIDVTFGETRRDTLPPIAVLPKMAAEFMKLESWRATTPPAGRLFVNLRELGSENDLVLHPVGNLQVSQRFAPLNLPLDRIGAQKPSDVNRVAVEVTSGALVVKGAVREKFAAAQYRDMDDAAKLSAPAYEPLESGVELGPAGDSWATGTSAERIVRYETIIMDTALERKPIRFFPFWAGLLSHFWRGAAIAKSPVSLAAEQRLKPFADKVVVTGDRFTVAFQADNRPFTTTAIFASFAEAQAHLNDTIRVNPTFAETIHVIPAVEVNDAT
jgi:hypothetical protein